MSSRIENEFLAKECDVDESKIFNASQMEEYQFTTIIDNKVFTTEFMTKSEAMKVNALLNIKKETKRMRNV